MEKIQIENEVLRNEAYMSQTFWVKLHWAGNVIPFGSIVYWKDIKENMGETPINFYGLDRFLLRLEEICNELDVLPRELKLRSFKGKKSRIDLSIQKSTTQMYKSPLSFCIILIRRDFFSLQGSMLVMGQQCYFRSGLELIKLMHEMIDVMRLKYEKSCAIDK